VLHRVVRGHLATLRLQCAEAGGLPRFVERDFERYLECGVLARGFTRLACRLCGEERLVAFSCKASWGPLGPRRRMKMGRAALSSPTPVFVTPKRPLMVSPRVQSWGSA